MITLKIIVIGAASVGKTSFLQAVSEIDVVSTGSDETGYFSFGRITIMPDELYLYLFEYIISQPMKMSSRFKDAIGKAGCVGTIVLLYGKERSEAPHRLIQTDWVKEFHRVRKMVSEWGFFYLIAANRQDHPNAKSIDELHKLYNIPNDVPIYPCDTKTDPNSVRHVILRVLEKMPQDQHVQQAITVMQHQIADSGE